MGTLPEIQKDEETAAELKGLAYNPIIAPAYRWSVWAAPKTPLGLLDHQRAMTGDDLKDFVNDELFPYLKKFKIDAELACPIEYKIGEIFNELKRP